MCPQALLALIPAAVGGTASAASTGLLTFGIGALQTGLEFMGARQTAKAEREAAVAANAQNQNALTLRQVQEGQALAQKKQQYNIEEAVAASQVEANAVAGGVDGLSLNNLLADVTRRSAYNRSVADQNFDMTIQQMESEKKGSASTAKSRVKAASGPSPLSLVAGLGAAGLSGYNAYSKAMS